MQISLDLPQRRILTVSDLTSLIKSDLEESFYDIWIEGEISNLRIPASGHSYLTLKDEASQIKAVLFKSSARNIKFELKDGIHIICHGRLTVYEPRGEYQIVIDLVEPRGIGALQLAFEQLKEKLAKEGLFDPERKRPIPLLPGKIGIITSLTGAAIRDMLNIINRRFANVHIIINPVPVQGEGAGAEIAKAIAEMNEFKDIDVLIVGRGGGSLEDLWAFNEEVVARAIYNSRIPVISAVGHEIDFTIADFVADLRAPTPSAAAELVVKNKIDLMESMSHLSSRLKNGIKTLFDAKRSALREEIRAMKDPATRINEYIQRIDDLSIRLSGRISRYLDGLKKQAEAAAGKLNALSPLATLSRGYSIAMKIPDMKIIKEAGEVKEGDEVNIRLNKGSLICVVSKRTP
ncbi:MAG: exodeoxyribonuclease VII large subunit [Nitrospirae bacterium]|nr:exodeoxyribonuclease VII large subunit [Nitrospirota bacterium]